MKQVEFKKQFTGYFKAFVDGVESDYAIVITSHPSGTKNKSTYKVIKYVPNLPTGSIEVSPKPTHMFCIQMNLHKAKQFLIKELNK